MDTFEKGLEKLDKDTRETILDKYKQNETEAKLLLLFFLKIKCSIHDNFVAKFLDDSNLNHFDDKVNVMVDLIQGKSPIDIPNYYDALDLMTKDNENTLTNWD